LIAYIRDRKTWDAMTTNATRIDLKWAKSLAKAGLRKVNISIDSPEASIHDRIRGIPGAWEKPSRDFNICAPF
jgi:MoaA/NifB/PqqE/SkfB family radical SAM enzyme